MKNEKSCSYESHKTLECSLRLRDFLKRKILILKHLLNYCIILYYCIKNMSYERREYIFCLQISYARHTRTFDIPSVSTC